MESQMTAKTCDAIIGIIQEGQETRRHGCGVGRGRRRRLDCGPARQEGRREGDRHREPANHAWLSQHGVEAAAYGEGLADRLRKFGLNAFIDCHGGDRRAEL
jgi:hypothetical protein